MFNRRNVIYNYDGTLEGFLCCVFESFTHKETPDDIVSLKDSQPSLLEQFNVETDIKKAQRVKKSVIKEMGGESFIFIRDALMSCLDKKETHMLEFISLGLKAGPKILNMLANDTVNTLTKAVKQLRHEAHKYTGFVRFSLHGDMLLSKIKPKNFVLPFLAPHFADRLRNEKFIIYDETHNAVCAYAKGRYVISDASDVQMPAPDEKESFYRDLWKLFYDTAAVEGRENPKCRMTLMPKRYWDNMTEFQSGNGSRKKKSGDTEKKDILRLAQPEI